MTAIETLSGVIAQRAQASKSSLESQIAFSLLKTAGLVQEIGKVQSVVCDECSDPHDAEIVFEDGTYGFYCHEAGFVPLEVDKVAAIKPNVAKLVSDIAALFDCKRRKSSPVNGDTWRIGSIDTPGGDLALYFQPTLQNDQDIRAVESALGGETSSAFRLIITAVGKLSILGAKSAELVDIIELNCRTNELAALADPKIIAGAPQAITNGRPNLYADKLEPLILQRIKDGSALAGLNKEAKAIREELAERSSDGQVPSLSTVKTYLSNLRAGQ